jgi:two-component system NarL family sensor kinase
VSRAHFPHVDFTRLPLESTETVRSFAVLRVVLSVTALAAVAAFEPPDRQSLAIILGALAVPWAVSVLMLAQRDPQRALTPLVAAGDLVILALAQIVAPDTYAGVRFLALFMIAAHAHFQGERRGVWVASGGILALVPTALVSEDPVEGDILFFYETLFAVSALCAGYFVGRMRTAESAGRLRARELSRRVIEAEGAVRRRVAESIHDGPVQELVSLDMMLSSAETAAQRGEVDRAAETLAEARTIAERNIRVLRDEIVGLGPYAFDELTLDTAVEECAPLWRRRYGFELQLQLDSLDLPNDLCGALFGIVQEAVTNAGRHSRAKNVTISVRQADGLVELRVGDDGTGFQGEMPLDSREPGHIGLASMRERAELIDGELAIETGPEGTEVVVRAPVPTAGDRPGGL